MSGYLDDFGPNVHESSASTEHGQAESVDEEAEWAAHERRLALMLQCSEAALNKTRAEAQFASDYPPPCDFPEGE